MDNQGTQQLTLDTVNYNENYRVLNGATAQLVRGLVDMLNRVSVENEVDDYKRVLYPQLRELVNGLVDRFTAMLHTETEDDYEVRRFAFFGVNGAVKRYNGRPPFVRGVKPLTRFKYANFGDFLKVLKHRCEFVRSQQVPKRYAESEAQTTAFTTMQTEVNDFVAYMTNETEPRWNEAVNSARQAANVVVQPRQPRQSREQRDYQQRDYQQRDYQQRDYQHQDGQNRGRGRGRGRGNYQGNRRPYQQRQQMAE